jgi:Family of unknown function (DUF6262)
MPRADNSHFVIAAARRRAAATHKRAVSALRRMDKAGLPITFEAVARQAGVSRSWLYNQPDLRTEIERVRARRHPPTPHAPVPDRQRASDASLLQRLQAATERIKHLQAENKQLREALAHALGQQRTNAIHGDHRDTPTTKAPARIGPC